MGEMTDLRRHVRVSIERPVYVSTPLGDGEVQSLWSHQLGEGGCLLVNDCFLGIGRVFVMNLMLNSTTVVRAIGKILYEYRDRTGKVCSGVEFQYIDPISHRFLLSYIKPRIEAHSVVACA